MKARRIRRRDDFRAVIASAFERAKNAHETSEQLIARWAGEDCWKHPHFQRLTYAEIGYLTGYREALQDVLWRRDVIWRLGSVDGPLPENVDGWIPKTCCVSATKLRAIKCPICEHDLQNSTGSVLGDLARTPGALYGGHFWRGTDTPFTEYRITNGLHVPKE